MQRVVERTILFIENTKRVYAYLTVGLFYVIFGVLYALLFFVVQFFLIYKMDDSRMADMYMNSGLVFTFLPPITFCAIILLNRYYVDKRNNKDSNGKNSDSDPEKNDSEQSVEMSPLIVEQQQQQQGGEDTPPAAVTRFDLFVNEQGNT